MRTKKQERKFKETGTNNYRFKIRPEDLENGIIKKKNRSYFWKLWSSVYQTNLREDENNELWGKQNSLQTLWKYPKAGRKNLTLERRGKYQSFSTQILHFSWGYFPVLMGWGFTAGASGKESSCQSRWHKRQGFDPWAEKIPWRRKWQPT